MSSKRSKRRMSDSSEEMKKKKQPKNPKLDEFKQHIDEVAEAFKIYTTKINPHVGELSGKQKIVLIYEDKGKKGKMVQSRSEPMSKKDIGKYGTGIRNALLESKTLGAKAVSAASKKSPNTGNLQVRPIKADKVKFFTDVLEEAGVAEKFTFTDPDGEPYASPALLQKIVMSYIYQNNLHKDITNVLEEGGYGKKKINKGKDRKDWTKSHFVVDDKLSKILEDKNGKNPKSGSQLTPIKVTSMLTNILGKADKKLLFPKYSGKASEKSEFAPHNRLTRYVTKIKDLIAAWKKENKKKKVSEKKYAEFSSEAARAVLEEEDIEVKGSAKDIKKDTALKKADPALYWAGVVDSEVKIADDVLSSLRK